MIGVIGCAAAFAGLAWLAYRPSVTSVDVRLLNRLMPVGEGGFAARWGERIVHLGDPASALAIAAAACAVALLSGRWSRAIAAAVLVSGASATTLILKNQLAHWRFDPALGYDQIVVTGLPSGHSTALAAEALALALVAPPRWRPLTIALAGGIALLGSFALVILGDHFASDVVAGWLVAGCWFFAVLTGLRLAEVLRCSLANRSPARAPQATTEPGG
ncbi:MAG: phosphatase PAP2 family protein [Solirubrobacterales bacterium]